MDRQAEGAFLTSVTDERLQLRKEVARLRHPFRNVDRLDWQHLAMWIPDSGHGRFWKSVFAELKTALNDT